MEIKKISLIAALKFSLTSFKTNFLFLDLGIFIILATSFLAAFIVELARVDFLFISVIVYIVSIGLDLIFDMGLINLALKIVSKRSLRIKDLFSTYNLLTSYLGMVLIWMIMTVLGLVFFIIPGIIILFRFILAPFLIVDRKISALDALKRSYLMTKGRIKELITFTTVLNLINLPLIIGVFMFMLIPSQNLTPMITSLGVILLIIGVFITAPISMLAMVFFYRNLPVISPR